MAESGGYAKERARHTSGSYLENGAGWSLLVWRQNGRKKKDGRMDEEGQEAIGKRREIGKVGEEKKMRVQERELVKSDGRYGLRRGNG